jgi:steroid 5-alpha reductase family enzyme
MVNEVDPKLANELIPIAGFHFTAAPVLGATLSAALAMFTLVWAIHVKIEDAGIVDFLWGGAFAVTGWSGAVLAGGASPTTLLLLCLVTLWATRLTLHMVWRRGLMDGEDARYRAMRIAGGPAFWWRSLFTLFWLQAVVQWLVASPLLVAVLVPAETVSVPLAGLGVALFAFGLAIEATADAQLWRFKSRPENRGRLMTSGLFAWSRHPNYFGEAVLWWGLGLVAYAGSGSMLAFGGPALLTALLLRISGVALLDAHLATTKPGYAEWASRTRAFLPRPPGRRLAAADIEPAN